MNTHQENLFRVDPRIAEILGESYRSSEQALKELVDNAWDAAATRVEIKLPDPMEVDLQSRWRSAPSSSKKPSPPR